MKRNTIVIVSIIGLLVIVWIIFMQRWRPVVQQQNEKFMYGFNSYEEYLANRTEWQKNADAELIKTIMDSGEVKSLEEAASDACQRWIELISKGDAKTGIKRINQAGILDPENACIYANYGYYLAFQKDDIEGASLMYEKAIKLMKKDQIWWISINYAEVLDYCFFKDKKRTDCLEKALIHAKEAEKEAPDASKVYYILSGIYIHLQDKENALKYIDLYKEKGGNPRNWALLQMMYSTGIK